MRGKFQPFFLFPDDYGQTFYLYELEFSMQADIEN